MEMTCSRWPSFIIAIDSELATHKVNFFFFQAEDGILDLYVTGVQTCALPISGVIVRNRSVPPPAGTPWLRSTTRPATDAAIAVTSITGRRQGRGGRRVSAVVIRA